MTYCQRCGELNRAEKCTKCGNPLQSKTSAPSMSALHTPKIDRWQSSYLGSFMGLDSLLSPPPVDDNNSSTTTPSSPVSSTTSSSSLLSRSRRPTLSSLWESNKRIAPSPRPPVATKITVTTAANNKKPCCPECNKALSGKTVRLPDSSTRYHWACLKCAHCREPFDNTSFYTDNASRIYHPKCSPMMMNKSCLRCSTEIKDAYIVIHNRAMHPKCFRCTSCQKVLQPSSVYTDAKTAVFCQSCSNDKLQLASRQTKIVPQLHPPPASFPIADSMDRLSLAPSSISGGSRASSQTSSPIPSSPASPTTSTASTATVASATGTASGGGSSLATVAAAAATIVKPSSLMSRRGRPLPKFGMLLDSAAVVHDNSATGGLDPWCTICLLVKKKEDANTTSTTTATAAAAKTVACE
ncbi:hypothetical protein BDB00DRAFT_932659 [Zychaea mexicana]|uniref:uncharacterized protein n=1 Tax=Zychaea mexicana TaxID=64656 RepID=UPI0022FE31E7|nr:uncharacterized protein BDB00DRAFT_932659 [Zychaea mexicana]KAI9488545.1 hypothetical protein BDB00DRAFT_932659 [Zychaea mexicana]